MNLAIAIEWRQRELAIEPSAALVPDAPARALARRWLDDGIDRFAGLRGVAHRWGLFLIGEASLLPWVRDVSYFGRDPRAPGPLWPTALEPTAPPALVGRALARACPGPFAAIPEPPSVLPLADARSICPKALAAWLTEPGASKASP